MDRVSPLTRSRMMASIGSRHTKPEVLIRSALFARGLRYRLHAKKLPGRPDLVLPKYRAVIQINGCFWHGHHCPLFKWPASHQQFWRDKIIGNMARDKANQRAMDRLGWRVLVVWECALKGRNKMRMAELVDRIEQWLADAGGAMDIPCPAYCTLNHPHDCRQQQPYLYPKDVQIGTAGKWAKPQPPGPVGLE